MTREFSALLRAWYGAHKRDLRWRQTRDAYCIWLSETILQQTRVQQGAAYYDRFVEAYPTVEALARASEDQVLKMWQGLGYYSRARNLLAAARQVVARFGGVFPEDEADLRTLPGVGEYTAAAIASIAYDRPCAVVDGNVYRLYARLFDLETPIDSTAGHKAFRLVAEELLDREHPGEFNQALMEFGALHCTPTSPLCDDCPFADRCQARAAGTVRQRPVKQGRAKVRDRYLHYLHLEADGMTLIRRREGRDIWQGLYEFPMVESEAEQPLEQLPLDDLLKGLSWQLVREAQMPPHLLSHQRLHAHFYRLRLDRLPEIEGCRAIPEEALGDYAVPRLLERYLEEYSSND
ncbi:MAG: A/G-specific adenine glycosylase [Alistipes sp.]|nr:A/G-specific adenine glycosylase [Alistipes sp.]